MPLHYTKHDVQWGFKLDLTGNYHLLGREHDFFVGYAYNNEKSVLLIQKSIKTVILSVLKVMQVQAVAAFIPMVRSVIL